LGFFHCTGTLQSDNRPAMKLILSLVPLCAMLLPCALSAATFEGKVTMTMTATGSKDGSQTINYSIKEGYMRMDVTGVKGGGAFITDFKNRQIIILIPQQRMYMVKSLPDPSTYQKPATPGAIPRTSDTSHTSFRDTGVKETILGYECEKYEVTTSKATTDIWATDQLGMFGGLSMAGASGRHSPAPQEWESVIKGSGFFPLRVSSNDGGKEKFRLEVTAVEKTSLPDSLFTPPDGWHKFDLGSMLGGAFQGAFPGTHSSDGNN
jgi:hypothetical protein